MLVGLGFLNTVESRVMAESRVMVGESDSDRNSWINLSTADLMQKNLLAPGIFGMVKYDVNDTVGFFVPS